MAEKKTKLMQGPVYFNGPIELLPHYNKNQIITCVCESCEKQFSIKFSSLRRKTNLLCKHCGLMLHTPYKANGLKISSTKKSNNKLLTSEEKYSKFVLPQLNRDETLKKKSIESYQKTMRSKSKTDIDLMKQRMKDAKASMTDEQKKEREQKFLKSFYESQGNHIIKNAESKLKSKSIKFEYIDSFQFKCYCDNCNSCYIWSPVKKSRYFMHSPHCDNCAKQTVSHYELEICHMLDETGVNYIHNDRAILRPKELDFFIPSKNIAIEFDGLYWHNKSKKSLEKAKLCNKKGIRFIDIFENEYNYLKVNSFLKSILEKPKNITSYEIKSISDIDYQNFCYKNDLNNYKSADVKLGLFLNDELSEIMSFSKLKSNKWKIVRNCARCGLNIDGKKVLFDYFLKAYDPTAVEAYCCKRWDTGEAYLKLGMKQLKDTKPRLIKINDDIKMYDFGQRVFEWRKQ